MTRHVLIAGTGRAGTTFLVQLLQACGLDTGSESPDLEFDVHANAGLEVLPNAPGPIPYVIKSPWSHHVLEDAIERLGRQFDAMVVPMRGLDEAATSRIIVELQAIHRAGVSDVAWPPDGFWDTWGGAAGGMTYSLEPLDLARVLAVALHRQLEVAVRFEIPIVFVDFPRVVQDVEYAFRALRPILRDVPEERFREGFVATADAAKVRVRATADVAAASSPDPGRVEATLDEADRQALRRALVDVRQRAVDAEAELAAREAETADLQGRLNEAERRCVELERDLASESATLHAVVGSRSWRITRPLRAVRRRQP